ncbi:hypothetical protein IAT38_008156 [Cryptococcus sp. DSM 104549]
MITNPTTALVALLSIAVSAEATFSSYAYGGIGSKFNFGCSTSVKQKATSSQKNDCSSSGSFFTSFGGNPLCCSSSTRTPPKSGLTCPFNWGMHKTAGCCIPQQEVSPCDCGEGYTFNDNTKKCEQKTNKCGGNQWWHERTGECCDNSWTWSPPKGSCPSGIKCPTDWFWHKTQKKCKPLKPRSPEPDCDDWNEGNQCCGGHTNPSQGSGHNGGGGKHGGQWNQDQSGKKTQADVEKWFSNFASSSGAGSGWSTKGKREFQARQQTALFPQTDLDKMYCPGSLHACTVPSTLGGEWSYECVDPATELESCGGCASTGEGKDCTQIANAMSVGCEAGVCAVYSCKSGFAANGTECVSV